MVMLRDALELHAQLTSSIPFVRLSLLCGSLNIFFMYLYVLHVLIFFILHYISLCVNQIILHNNTIIENTKKNKSMITFKK